jgi:hypothetical protein
VSLTLTYDTQLSRVRIVATGLDALNPNPFFETNSVGWAPVQGTFAQVTDQKHEGVASGKLTPNGTGAVVSVEATPSTAVAVVPGKAYNLSAWLYAPTGWSQVSVTVNWLDASDVAISSPTGVVLAVPAAVWTQQTAVVTAPAGAAKGGLRIRMAGTPATTNVLYVDEAKFGATVINFERSANGIRWTTVRGGTDVPVVGGVASLDDYEFESGG